MSRRAAAAEETRRRILEASVKLHSERGFAATSWQDIATEADVAVGTVYFHFPTMDDLVPACSAFGMSRRPPPSEEIFVGVRGRRARLERLVASLFDYYGKAERPLSHTYAERSSVPAVERFTAEMQRRVRALVTQALGPDAPPELVDEVDALVDFRVWQSLRDRELSHAAATSLVTSLVVKRSTNH
jgi:AcrR family transcriptional regulator